MPAARLNLIEFKTQTKDSKDPEILKMRAESGLVLRTLTLAGLEKLANWAEAFEVQKKSSTITTVYKHATQGGYERLNMFLVAKLIESVKAGKADTVEEGILALKAQHLEDIAEIRKHPVAGFEQKVVYLYEDPAGPAEKKQQFSDDTQVKKLFELYEKDPMDPKAAGLKDPKAFPGSCFFKLEGGTLDLGVAGADDTKYPPKIRVVIGKEGGIIRADGGTYKFPPSSGERVVLISSGRLNPGKLKRDTSVEGGAKGDFETFSWTALENQKYSKSNDAAKRLQGVIDHASNLKANDADFYSLFSLETKEGLEKIKDPEARRGHLLGLAEQMRHRTGCYAVSAEILEGLFAKDFQEALAALPVDQLDKVRKEVEAERPKVEKQVKSDLVKMKEKHPDEYGKRFPKGEPSETEIKKMVDQALDGKLAVKVRKMAFEKIDAKAKAGSLSDAIATKAWKVYDGMKDPTDKTWQMADETVDGIVDEVVITAVTMPITMGVGSMVRGGLGGTSLALRWVSQGGGRALAMRAGIFLGGALAEGYTMAALAPGDFEWKNVGFNTLMSIAFHGGGKAWGKAGAKLGVDEVALMALRAEGKSVAGKSAVNFAGTMLTQTTVATTMGYVGELAMNHENPNTFWERFGGEALRMVAFHYGTHALNMATGNLAVEADQALQVKMKAARESYLKWVEGGKPPAEAAKLAVEYVRDAKVDPKTGEIVVDLKAADISAHAFAEGDNVYAVPGKTPGDFEYQKLSSKKPEKGAVYEEVDIGGKTFYRSKVDAAAHEAFLAWTKTSGKPGEKIGLSKGKISDLETGFKAGQTVVPSVGKLGSAEFHAVSKDPVPGDASFEKVTVGKTTFYRKPVDAATYEAYQAWQKRTTPPPLPKAVEKKDSKPKPEPKLEDMPMDQAALKGVDAVDLQALAKKPGDLSPEQIELRKGIFLKTLDFAKDLGFATINPFLAASYKKFAERLVSDPQPEKSLSRMKEMIEGLAHATKDLPPAEAMGLRETLLTEILIGKLPSKTALEKRLLHLEAKMGAHDDTAVTPKEPDPDTVVDAKPPGMPAEAGKEKKLAANSGVLEEKGKGEVRELKFDGDSHENLYQKVNVDGVEIRIVGDVQSNEYELLHYGVDFKGKPVSVVVRHADGKIELAKSPSDSKYSTHRLRLLDGDSIFIGDKELVFRSPQGLGNFQAKEVAKWGGAPKELKNPPAEKMEDGGWGPDAVKIPKAPKLPGELERPAAVETALFEEVYPNPEGRPSFKQAFMREEVGAIVERFEGSGQTELGILIRSDLEIAMKAPYDSPAYQGAIMRLGKVLGLRRGSAEYSFQPVQFMESGKLQKFAGETAKIYEIEPQEIPKTASLDGTAGPTKEKQAVSDLEAMRLLKAVGFEKGFSKHLEAIRKM
ncbi:MAG: hypothetical protein K8R69_09730, partial [Deltaproteobacteria bacterium]|nr:hypothetical protein [Deltaproteobacteria bacterium]